jgi:hypothetical protein
MAHYAKLDENNIVLEVHVVNNSEMLDHTGQENEEVGKAFLIQWSGGYTNWKQTSYNGNFRKNYAGIGYIYDSGRDAFIPPKPYPSWQLNETTCQWHAPVEPPLTEFSLQWNETEQKWEIIE